MLTIPYNNNFYYDLTANRDINKYEYLLVEQDP